MTSPRAIRILIVDDSAVMRSLLRSVVLAASTAALPLEVAGTASDGASSLRAMESLSPDLILLDVEMPGMDGLTTLKEMKARGRREPVIMCSALTQRGAQVTIEALASGAADYVAKPAGQASREAAVAALAGDLVPKIVALTGLGTGSMGSGIASASRSYGPFTPLAAVPKMVATGPPGVLLIGVSTGGPAALDVLLPALPGSFPLPVLVVQHMPELFTKLLAERLDGRCPLRVVEAVEGQAVRAGTVYIAKGNWHLEVVAGSTPTLRLTQEPLENHCRPAVDVLFRTAVAVYGSRVLGVILTGMGSDGLVGCRLIREQNGTVLAQDQATSAVWGMPGAVAQAGLAQRILPLHAIAGEILRLAQSTGRGQREAFELRESAV